MKYLSAVVAGLLLTGNKAEAHKLERHHHHHFPGSSWEKDFVQIGLRANDDMIAEVKEKMKKVSNLIEIKKLESITLE